MEKYINRKLDLIEYIKPLIGFSASLINGKRKGI